MGEYAPVYSIVTALLLKTYSLRIFMFSVSEKTNLFIVSSPFFAVKTKFFGCAFIVTVTVRGFAAVSDG